VDEEAEGKPRYVGTVTIKGGTFTGNGKVVSGAGKSFGGVVNNLGNLYITGGTFGGENASDANYAQQGAVVFNSDYAEITGGEFVGNKATAGALATNNSPANGIAKTVTKIGAATFSKNQGTDGGAIFIHQKGDLEIDGTTFTENKAAGHGGAIQLQKNTSLLIKDGTFTGNKTIGSTSIDGGAIFVNSNVSATIENGTFTGNTAKGKGGVIYSLSALTIDGGTFQNNSATGGGVVWADANVTVKDGIFKNNTATDGGVFFIDAGASADAPNVLTIKDGEFYGNKSTGTAANTNGGGVVHLRGFTKLDVQGGIFGAADAGNTSATDGGVIYRSAGEEGKTAKTVITITKTEGVELKFSHNQALGNNRMGGVFAFPSGAVTEFSADGAEFSYNKAVTGTAGNGGVFYNHTGGTMTLENCAFIGNEATGGGGVVYTAASSTLDVENCSFESNKAMYGGVMRNKAVANFSGSTFTGNTATDCGALYNDSQMTVKDCDFDGNTASKRGGAIFHNGTALTVDADCTFGTTKANTDTNNGGAVRTNDVWVHNGKPHTISATYVGWDQKAAKPLP